MLSNVLKEDNTMTITMEINEVLKIAKEIKKNRKCCW